LRDGFPAENNPRYGAFATLDCEKTHFFTVGKRTRSFQSPFLESINYFLFFSKGAAKNHQIFSGKRDLIDVFPQLHGPMQRRINRHPTNVHSLLELSAICNAKARVFLKVRHRLFRFAPALTSDGGLDTFPLPVDLLQTSLNAPLI
jgi:hypothetical protein